MVEEPGDGLRPTGRDEKRERERHMSRTEIEEWERACWRPVAHLAANRGQRHGSRIADAVRLAHDDGHTRQLNNKNRNVQGDMTRVIGRKLREFYSAVHDDSSHPPIPRSSGR